MHDIALTTVPPNPVGFPTKNEYLNVITWNATGLHEDDFEYVGSYVR